MASQTRPQEVGKSYAFTRGRFDLPDAADHYATRHGGHRRDQREQRCIERALAGVPAGARVLDLPCGVGRLAPMLVKRGYELTQADVSAHMIEKARWAWTMHCASTPQNLPRVTFAVRDVMASGFADGSFDAVICNRLLHHFVESRTRVAALRELARISRGPVIASFFNAFSLDTITFWMKNAALMRIPRDRVPIPMKRFLADAAAAGLNMEAAFPTRWGISPQWYLRLNQV